MRTADLADPCDPLADRVRGRRVVVEGARSGAAREDPGVVRASDDDADPAPRAEGEKTLERLLLEQGVATGEEKEIEVSPLREGLADLPLVHPAPDGPDHPLLAERDHGPIAGGHELVDPGIRSGLRTVVRGRRCRARRGCPRDPRRAVRGRTRGCAGSHRGCSRRPRAARAPRTICPYPFAHRARRPRGAAPPLVERT